MSSMKFICPIATLTNPIFTFILDLILIHQLITEIQHCPSSSLTQTVATAVVLVQDD